MHHPTIARAPLTAAVLLLAALGAAGLAGCDKKDGEPTVGNKVDSAIAKTEQKAGEFKAEAGKELSEAKVAANDMAKGAKQAAANASEKAGDKVNDAMITTSVNAELAKDASLSALKINVDTAGGRVALKGTAPSASARERATSLALAVKGVVSVDNQLSVEPSKM